MFTGLVCDFHLSWLARNGGWSDQWRNVVLAYRSLVSSGVHLLLLLVLVVVQWVIIGDTIVWNVTRVNTVSRLVVLLKVFTGARGPVIAVATSLVVWSGVPSAVVLGISWRLAETSTSTTVLLRRSRCVLFHRVMLLLRLALSWRLRWHLRWLLLLLLLLLWSRLAHTGRFFLAVVSCWQPELSGITHSNQKIFSIYNK